MQRYISILRSNPFLQNNLIFFLGSLSVGALNYLYYPVIGRLLSPSAFGEVQTLISLFLQLTIFLNVLGLVAVNLIANSRDERAQRVVTELQLASLWLCFVILLVTITTAPYLQSALRFSSAWPFILLVIALVALVPFTFQTSYLRARQRFGAVSLASMLVAGGKIIFAVMLVLAGFSTNGAIGGLIAAQLIGLAYAFHQAQGGQVRGVVTALRRRWWPDIRIVLSEIKYVGYVLVGSLGVMILLSLDVIIVKYFFDAHTAGLYAGIATVARIIFFLTGSISQVLLPSVRLDHAAHENRALLTKSLLFLSVLSAPVLLICTLKPEWLMQLLMGAQYTVYSGLLVPLSWAIFFVSILNVLVIYCLALRQYVPAVLTMIGAILTYASMFVWHSTLSDIVMVLLGGSIIVTSLVVGWLLLHRDKGGTNNAA